MDSRKCSRIFSGVPEITVYLHKAGGDAAALLPEDRADTKRDTKHVLDASEGRGAGTLF